MPSDDALDAFAFAASQFSKDVNMGGNQNLAERLREAMLEKQKDYNFKERRSFPALFIGGQADGQVKEIEAYQAQRYEVAVLRRTQYTEVIDAAIPIGEMVPMYVHRYHAKNLVMFEVDNGEFDDDMQDLPSTKVIFMVWDGQNHAR